MTPRSLLLTVSAYLCLFPLFVRVSSAGDRRKRNLWALPPSGNTFSWQQFWTRLFNWPTFTLVTPKSFSLTHNFLLCSKRLFPSDYWALPRHPIVTSKSKSPLPNWPHSLCSPSWSMAPWLRSSIDSHSLLTSCQQITPVESIPKMSHQAAPASILPAAALIQITISSCLQHSLHGSELTSILKQTF